MTDSDKVLICSVYISGQGSLGATEDQLPGGRQLSVTAEGEVNATAEGELDVTADGELRKCNRGGGTELSRSVIGAEGA